MAWSVNHVEPNNLQQVNVRLAVQLFSNSVADGTTFYKAQGASEMKTCDTTIVFVRRLNQLFDILNAKLPHSGLRLIFKNMKFLEECIVWVDEWESYT